MNQSDTTNAEHEYATEYIAAGPADLLAAILDLDERVGFSNGAAIPPLWHWAYLLPRPAQRHLGPDGHPTSGIPTPPGPGLRRMFAGGRVTTHRPLVVGSEASRTTQVADRVTKQGRSGPLEFVTVRTEIRQNDELAIVDERDLVYREPGTDQPRQSQSQNDPDPRLENTPQQHLDVDETLLFRFSGLTLNAHRIHYDHRWAQHEGYDDLVVHGPLQALMMGELMRHNGMELVGQTFTYRLVAPMVGPQRLTVAADDDGLESGAVAGGATGRVTATATLSSTPND